MAICIGVAVSSSRSRVQSDKSLSSFRYWLGWRCLDVVRVAITGVVGFVDDYEVVVPVPRRFEKERCVSPCPVVRRYRLWLRPVVMRCELFSPVRIYKYYVALPSLHNWNADIQPVVQLVLPLAAAAGGSKYEKPACLALVDTPLE